MKLQVLKELVIGLLYIRMIGLIIQGIMVHSVMKKASQRFSDISNKLTGNIIFCGIIIPFIFQIILLHNVKKEKLGMIIFCQILLLTSMFYNTSKSLLPSLEPEDEKTSTFAHLAITDFLYFFSSVVLLFVLFSYCNRLERSKDARAGRVISQEQALVAQSPSVGGSVYQYQGLSSDLPPAYHTVNECTTNQTVQAPASGGIVNQLQGTPVVQSVSAAGMVHQQQRVPVSLAIYPTVNV